MQNLLFFFLLFPVAHASAETSPVTSSTISGVVRDPRGRPLPGATVLLYAPADLPFQDPEILQTDPEGRFRSVLETSDDCSVIVIAPGFAPYLDDTVSSGKPVEAELTYGEELAGRVLDARSKAPISGARVQTDVFPSTRRRPSKDPLIGVVEATTDDRGKFRIEGIPHGPRTLSASAPGYRRESVTASRAGIVSARLSRSGRWR